MYRTHLGSWRHRRTRGGGEAGDRGQGDTLSRPGVSPPLVFLQEPASPRLFLQRFSLRFPKNQ